MDNFNYGIIGNCRSGALISEKGSIDWCCLPEFNSSSVFARLLDNERGGSFGIFVDDDYAITQQYVPRTNLLETRFKKGTDEFRIIDFMPRYHTTEKEYYSPPDLIRYVRHISGTPAFRVKFDPRLEYARFNTKTIITSEYIKSFTSKGTYDSLYLYTNFDKNKVINGEMLELTSDAFFLISYNQKILEQTVDRSYLKMERTKVYWLNWSERTRKYTRYNTEILRSALTLKLLSYDKSGAIIAALTTSIPETIGGIRNWDYRYCWLRDASMVIKVMIDLGHYYVARQYLKFILDILPDKDEKMQIMYGIHGERVLTEKTLDHLSGYMDSKPVRIGNAAYRQKQNDIYGVLMDVIYQQFNIFTTTLENSEALWTITRSIVKIVASNWRKPDRGIWELRSEPKHFTFSKVLCWVAIDRALKIAQLLKMKNFYAPWIKIRDQIRKDILKNAWNDEIGAFTQAYGNHNLDAANLLIEPFGFIPATDPKYIGTVKATQAVLSRNGLMYRYRNADDFGLQKSSFTICIFWLVNALYKIGEKEVAINLFEQVLGYSNHLGLFSEDLDFDTKQLLGNFPQAYSHLSLIETAVLISSGEITREEELLNALK
jgi:GH15 family glucan-1,4-alpha-glucosidase